MSETRGLRAAPIDEDERRGEWIRRYGNEWIDVLLVVVVVNQRSKAAGY